jgi:hypothetical protein
MICKVHCFRATPFTEQTTSSWLKTNYSTPETEEFMIDAQERSEKI